MIRAWWQAQSERDRRTLAVGALVVVLLLGWAPLRHVKLSFENANFDALAQWLEQLASGYGVTTTELSADRADGAGLVNARVTLQDAP